MEGTVQEGVSKTGTPYVIRYPRQEDVESVWKYANRLSQEKTYVRFQGEDIPLEDEVKVVEKWIKKAAEGTEVTLFLVIDGVVQGICCAARSDKTESHIAGLGLSVDKTVRGEGLGEILMQAVLDESKKRMEGLRLFKLEVKAPNDRALALYQKLGFKEYGRLPEGTQHQGAYVDELFMYREV